MCNMQTALRAAQHRPTEAAALQQQGGRKRRDGGAPTCQHAGNQNAHRLPNTHAAGPTEFAPVSAANPWTNLYYTVEMPGLFKYIALTSYSPGQTFNQSEEQYVWLEEQLRTVGGAGLASGQERMQLTRAGSAGLVAATQWRCAPRPRLLPPPCPLL